ncbi:MAG TPA: ABC transporter substrate-binding protein [Methanothrix sp.]|nr:ABC transporter substrate-binding protein [Methanothrix sp.]
MNVKFSGFVLISLMLLSCLGIVEGAEAETITIFDGMNRSVEVPCPPERIVSTTASASELISIFGGMDNIVGRDEYSTFPPVLEEKPVVGSYSKTTNVELALDLDPDVVISDTSMLPETIEQIEDAGVPVVIVGMNCELDSIIYNIRVIGEMMDDQEKAEELTGFIQGYVDLIQERTRDLDEDEKPLVYHECREYKSNAAGTPKDEHINLAGGINIAHDESVERPIVSAEWVLENDPEIIVTRVSGTDPATEEMLKAKRDEILSRPGLKETSAVQNGEVYVYHPFLRRGPRLVGYLLYMGKWFHPDLFEDVDPAAVEKEMLEKFYGMEMEGTWAYPEI